MRMLEAPRRCPHTPKRFALGSLPLPLRGRGAWLRSNHRTWCTRTFRGASLPAQQRGTAMTKAALAATALALSITAASAQELRIGLQDDPDNLDPAISYSFVGRHVLSPLCDKLVDIDAQWKLVPQLALSW